MTTIFKAPTFRGQLLAKLEVEGPDGGVWKLGKSTGMSAGSRPWTFSRRMKEETRWTAYTDHRGATPEEAVDALEEYLHKRNGIKHLQDSDAWWRERRARIDDAFQRAKDACHSGLVWEIDSWSTLEVYHPDDRYSKVVRLHSSYVANGQVDVDAAIEQIVLWKPKEEGVDQ